MWISQQFARNAQVTPSVQSGRITLNDNGSVEAVSTGVQRSIGLCAPYGYMYSAPNGADMLLVSCAGEQTAIGVPMSADALKSGEIKIKAASGAFIYLKNNGSVVINGLEINRNGEIEYEE